MKTLILKKASLGDRCAETLEAALFQQGVSEAREFGARLKRMYPHLSIGIFSDDPCIYFRTAQEIADSLNPRLKPVVLEHLSERRGNVPFFTGLGPELSMCAEQFQVAVCVTNEDVMRCGRKFLGDANSKRGDKELRYTHGAQTHPFPSGRWMG